MDYPKKSLSGRLIMVQKGRTTVYVDMEKAQRIKEDLGIDLSKLTSQALDIADSDLFGDLAVDLRTKITNELIVETEDEIKKVQDRLVMLNQRLVEAKDKKERIVIEWQRTKKSVMYSRMLYQLNQVIIAAKYDITAVRVAAPDVMDDILIVSPLFNLEVHIAMLKKEMRA
jgi:hypothetical protein